MNLLKAGFIFMASLTVMGSTTVSSDTVYPATDVPVIEQPLKYSPSKEEIIAFASSTFDGTNLMDIAKCESGLNHFDVQGNVLRGYVDSDDIGFMQINSRYHEESAKKIGLNIYDPFDNIKYAKWLYDREGTRPWIPSIGCWG